MPLTCRVERVRKWLARSLEGWDSESPGQVCGTSKLEDALAAVIHGSAHVASAADDDAVEVLAVGALQNELVEQLRREFADVPMGAVEDVAAFAVGGLQTVQDIERRTLQKQAEEQRKKEAYQALLASIPSAEEIGPLTEAMVSKLWGKVDEQREIWKKYGSSKLGTFLRKFREGEIDAELCVQARYYLKHSKLMPKLLKPADEIDDGDALPGRWYYGKTHAFTIRRVKAESGKWAMIVSERRGNDTVEGELLPSAEGPPPPSSFPYPSWGAYLSNGGGLWIKHRHAVDATTAKEVVVLDRAYKARLTSDRVPALLAAYPNRQPGAVDPEDEDEDDAAMSDSDEHSASPETASPPTARAATASPVADFRATPPASESPVPPRPATPPPSPPPPPPAGDDAAPPASDDIRPPPPPPPRPPPPAAVMFGGLPKGPTLGAPPPALGAPVGLQIPQAAAAVRMTGSEPLAVGKLSFAFGAKSKVAATKKLANFGFGGDSDDDDEQVDTRPSKPKPGAVNPLAPAPAQTPAVVTPAPAEAVAPPSLVVAPPAEAPAPAPAAPAPAAPDSETVAPAAPARASRSQSREVRRPRERDVSRSCTPERRRQGSRDRRRRRSTSRSRSRGRRRRSRSRSRSRSPRRGDARKRRRSSSPPSPRDRKRVRRGDSRDDRRRGRSDSRDRHRDSRYRDGRRGRYSPSRRDRSPYRSRR
eukprot:TRINITY_DN1580_c0_g1_i2.p1 TRINITY_DN1580_c0_g1~~TRINITY_DN1580_c0_g1_i2.p1  ORF type:complete len:704 (+),score=177.26 TRINITY_DN1580_c0_g1_i2:58-2169(+)